MAFDGMAVAALSFEFDTLLRNGRISKISQTEPDELMLTIKNADTQYRLILSANASLPLSYITQKTKSSPKTAPNFCMLLRKRIGNARIISIIQPGLERVIDFSLSRLDEMGDDCTFHLILELMGRHSNIILTDEQYIIIDSIKHIGASVSSVRQVLPGVKYFIPDTTGKKDPLQATKEDFFSSVFSKSMPLSKALYSTYTGLGPTIAQDICYRSKLDSQLFANTFKLGDQNLVWINFYQMIKRVKDRQFKPVIYEKSGHPEEFASMPLTTFTDCKPIFYDSMSRLIEDYYSKRELSTRMKQKSQDLRQVVSTALERDLRKYDIQKRQMEDTKKKDKYKLYGDLLSAYGYAVEEGAKSYTADNFYDGTKTEIPLDPKLTAIENAQKYYSKYSKLKRTKDALTKIIDDTSNSISYLESIDLAINMASTEDDLSLIRQELVQTGYIKGNSTDKKKKSSSIKPLHYVSSDGFHMYVGKNNIQNESLTFHTAVGSDWWFHAKKFPGSHVIVKCENKTLPDRTFEEAARLAAHYSKAAAQNKVEVDYTMKKNVKKVPGTMPGFVIYHTNYSMSVSPNITDIREITQTSL